MLDARGNVHMIEYLFSGGDPAGIIELDVDREPAGAVRPREGVVTELFEICGTARDLSDPIGIEGIRLDLLDIFRELQLILSLNLVCIVYQLSVAVVAEDRDLPAVKGLGNLEQRHILNRTGVMVDLIRAAVESEVEVGD